MLDIRPISDLRNHYNDIEQAVMSGSPVYLTKNGYGSMVVMSMQTFSRFLDMDIEDALDEADKQAEQDPRRFSHSEIFNKIRNRENGI